MDAGQHILHYRVVAPLGEGGMGQVFRAHDTRLDREVALKVLSPRLLGNDEARARFLREARLASQLDHPNICPVHAVEEDDEGNLVIVMALVEGRGLDEILQGGPVAAGDVVSLATQLAEALAAAHERGIIHRDLKPANLRVGSDGRLRVLDFGLARQAGGETLTQEGTSLGSPAWMSPEQVRGEPADERADLWAWGAIVTAMATGQAPFMRDSVHSMLFAIVQEEPAPAAWVGGIPAGLRTLAEACLAKDPAGRPASAAALLEGLRGGDAQATLVAAAGGDQTVVARPTARRARRRGGGATAGIGVAVVALLASAWWLRPPAEPTRVAMAPPQLAAGLTPSAGGLATLRYALEQEVLEREGLLPVSVPDSLGNPADVDARAAAVGAGQLVEVELSPEGRDWRVTLRQRRVGDPAVVWSTSFLADPGEPMELDAALRGHMADAFPAHPRRGDRPALRIDPAVYARLQQLRGQWSTTGGRQETEALLSGVDSLVALAPSHPGPARFGLELSSYLLMNDLRPDARSLVEGYAKAALDIDGSDPRSWRQLFGARLDDGDIPGAREALDGLSRVARSRAERRFAEGLLRYAEGEREEGLARLEEATHRLPSVAHLNVLADHYYRDDRLDEARATLEELLALHPGYGPARSKLAQIELLEGDPARAAELYLEIIEGQGGDAVEWSNLGLARQLTGDWAGAREAFATALAEAPGHPYLLLNAGDGAMLAGQEEEALRLYGDALAALGDGELAWDEHLARAQLRAHLGDARGAIRDLQAGLDGAEGTAEAHFVAALVYCLLEDPDNAIAHSGLAAEKGMAPRWFSLPWFDPIREDPAFGGVQGAAS